MSLLIMWKSDVHHLLAMCCVYMEVRIKFLISECLLFYILELPHIIFPNHIFEGHFKEK